MKILVVEDSDLKFKNINEWLTRCGDDVEIVHRYSRNGGLSAILDANKTDNPFDLLVLDMQIPLFENDFSKMVNDGGAEIVYMLDAKGINIPYVICSSVAKEKDFPDAIAVICYDYFTSYKTKFNEIIKSLKKGNRKDEE